MTDYYAFKALDVCMKDARRKAIDGGIEYCIFVVSIKNIPQEGSTPSMTDEISIERVMTWGCPDESKCDFVRKYVRDHRGNAPSMAWDAEIALGTVDYGSGKDGYGFTIAIGVLADTTEHGQTILENAQRTFTAVKV